MKNYGNIIYWNIMEGNPLIFVVGIFTLNFICLIGGGRVVRRCWVYFQCLGILLIWMIVGQGPIALAVGAGGGYLDIFTLLSFLFSFSLFLGDGPI